MIPISDIKIPDYLKVGFAGAGAMSVQVLSLMWLRTTVNYQYRTGHNMSTSFRNLYQEGGIRRFYRGVGPALIQAPMSRFGDTATNALVMGQLDAYDLPVWIKTAGASITAASWRLFLMPIDTLKTSLQVNGQSGVQILKDKLKTNGPKVMYNGAGATFTASWVGHYPWFVTYNVLNDSLPKYEPDQPIYYKFGRSAVIGFSSSLVSDTSSNAIRVCKTFKQTYPQQITYPEIVRKIVTEHSVFDLMFRGLRTKLISNGLQGMMFTIIWKSLQEMME